MSDLTQCVKDELLRGGADLVGFGNLSQLPPDARENLPVGICVAMKYPGSVIAGIDELPTQEYRRWYDLLNQRLDALVTLGAESLKARGYAAVAMTREHVGNGERSDHTLLPHKTVATRAGIGWIGKSALLVTQDYGSMIRLSSILTDAPLEAAEPVDTSRCGNCMICTKACPAGAVSGEPWRLGMRREELFNAEKCQETARERSRRGFGGEITICGKCIQVCPYTQRALARENA